jgi:dTDP-6-deoxy-L-talose 4-dehydrogenase (NAD+)
VVFRKLASPTRHLFVRILVTGGSGFLGRAFIRQALANGHAIAALVRPTSKVQLAPHPALTVAIGTIANPPWEALARFAPDACVHTAWITEIGIYRQSRENDRYVAESLALITALLQRGLRHVVALGTCAEYRPSTAPLFEMESPLEPSSPYGRAKHQLHVLLDERVRIAGARLAWVRIFQAYGPGESPLRLCSTVVRRVTGGEPVKLDMPGAVRDWVYLDDVASALLTLVERCADMVVNVGTGVGHTVDAVARIIAGMLGRVDLAPLPVASADASDAFVADLTRLRAMGWTPHIGLETGLARLVAALR